MGMGQGVRTGLGHGGITCVFQIQFSSGMCLKVMGGDGARGKDWLRAWGHHLCLPDTIF